MTITILLVDDHAVLLDSLKFMIETQAGLQVVDYDPGARNPFHR